MKIRIIISFLLIALMVYLNFIFDGSDYCYEVSLENKNKEFKGTYEGIIIANRSHIMEFKNEKNQFEEVNIDFISEIEMILVKGDTVCKNAGSNSIIVIKNGRHLSFPHVCNSDTLF